MPDIFPRRNLPNEAEQWGRAHDERVVSVETQIDSIRQSLSGQNRNTASSLESLATQLRAIEDQQEAIEAAQAELAAQQASILATTAFLSTQTSYDQKIGVSGGTRAGVAGIGYEPFDPAYDCSLTVTTAASGKLLLSAGGAITSSGAGAGIGPEVIGGSLPDFSTSAAAGEGSVVGASRSILVTLAGNTTYTVRTRRWWTGGTSQFVSYQSASLVVTRIA